MKKLGILILAMLLLTGCIETVTITEQENNMIAEYIAKTLLKYDKNHDSKLINTSVKEQTEETTEKPTEPVQTTTEAAEPTESTNADNSTSTSANDSSKKATIDGKEVSMSKVLGNKNLEITCRSYAVMDTYMDKDVFQIEASSNKKVLLLELSVKNISDKEQEFNVINNDIIFKIIINNQDTYTSLLTYYENDISESEMNIKPGNTVNGVLFFEIEGISKKKGITDLSIYAIKKNNFAIIPTK